jgi:hypothetical protein
MRGFAKIVIAFAAFAIVWLVASPARATLAPQCDARGAITFAPPPQLQPPEQSIDVTDGSAPSCLERFLTDGGVKQGSAPPSPSASGLEPTAIQATLEVRPSSKGELLAPEVPHMPHAIGVQARLERPPRT